MERVNAEFLKKSKKRRNNKNVIENSWNETVLETWHHLRSSAPATWSLMLAAVLVALTWVMRALRWLARATSDAAPEVRRAWDAVKDALRRRDPPGPGGSELP